MNTKYTLSTLTAATLFAFSSLSYADHGLSSIYDTDGDGTVTTEEVTAVRTADHTAADTDSTDGLSLAEFTTMQANIRTRYITAAFDKLNTSGDDSLSLEEFTASSTNTTRIAQLTNIFNLADTDANTSLNLAEFTALKAGGKSPIMQFARLDTDASQQVTLEEYLAVASRGGKRHGKGGRGRSRH